MASLEKDGARDTTQLTNRAFDNAKGKQQSDLSEKEDSGLSSSKYSVYSGKRDYTRLSSDMHISTPPAPTAVNIHQFYPSVDDHFSKQSSAASLVAADEKEPQDSTEPDKAEASEDNDELVKDSEKSDEDLTIAEPKREVSEARTVRFEDDVESTRSTDRTRDETFTSTTSDQQEESVFSTAVDEATLEAAKERQREGSVLFQPETWTDHQVEYVTMEKVIKDKADEHFLKGKEKFDKGNYEDAAKCFTKAINLKPKRIEYYIHRAESFFSMCDFQSAILNYKRACVVDPDNYDYYRRLAFIYYFQGQCLFDQKLYPEALEAFSRAAEMRPDMSGYHMRSIACLAALERHGECLALVNKRLETDQDNADLFVMRARLHELFRNYTLAFYDIKDALVLDAAHPQATGMMGVLEQKAQELKTQAMHLNIRGRHRDALQKISLAIETDPSIADFHILRGALHRRMSDFNAAIDDYLLALDKTDHDEENPVYQEGQRQLLLTYNDFAVECFTKGFYEEAVILLNKAIKGEKKEKGLYINRGDCFFRQNELTFALADYHQALELDPKDDSIKTRIAVVHNEYGVADYMEKNYQDAESRFTLAIQNNPKLGHYYISRTRCRHVMENVEGAKKDIVMALHLEPQNAELISLMARLFPGKSVTDILNSRMAEMARTAIVNLVPTASPVRLDPIQQQSEGTDEEMSMEAPSGGGLWKPSPSVPDWKMCMEEREFHVKIAKEKRKINKKVKNVLHNRQSLRHHGGRVQALSEPAPFKTQSSSSQGLVVQKSSWRKFNTGVSISNS